MIVSGPISRICNSNVLPCVPNSIFVCRLAFEKVLYLHFIFAVAFQEMLENPSANGHYITDPETGPVLLQISRIVQGFAR